MVKKPSERAPSVVIFDMDGLMIDTELLQSISFKKVLEKYGVKVKKKIVQILGVRVIENLEIMRKKYGLKVSVKTLFREKNEIYNRLLERSLIPMPGLLEIINSLKRAGFRLTLASSSNYDHIQVVLRKLKLQSCFEVVFSGEHVKKGKPDPEIYLKTARELKVKPKECLVLEDTQIGVEAAKKAGMKCVAVPNQYTKDHNFTKADLVISSLKGITIGTISQIMEGE